MIKTTALLLCIITIVSCETSSHDSNNIEHKPPAELFGSYTTPIIPIKFTFTSEGIKISLSRKFVTFLGTFEFGVAQHQFKNRTQYTTVDLRDAAPGHISKTYNFQNITVLTRHDIDKFILSPFDIVVVIERDHHKADVFVVKEGFGVRARMQNDLTILEAKANYLHVKAINSRELHIEVYPDSSSMLYPAFIEPYAPNEIILHSDIFNDTSNISDKKYTRYNSDVNTKTNQFAMDTFFEER